MDQLVARLSTARSVVLLSGAGISAESGLPTFRGVNGLWRDRRVEELASPAGFARDPVLVWSWYNERGAAHRSAQPNDGHRAIAALEACFDDFTVATQNVDSLHVRAGSRNVLELHGSLRRARCQGCATTIAIDDGLGLDAIDHDCGGRFRPDIVWFGESLPPQVWDRAVAAAERAEVMLVVGTSGIVNPAAALCSHYAGRAYVAEVNPEETALSAYADACFREPAAQFLPLLERALLR